MYIYISLYIYIHICIYIYIGIKHRWTNSYQSFSIRTYLFVMENMEPIFGSNPWGYLQWKKRPAPGWPCRASGVGPPSGWTTGCACAAGTWCLKAARPWRPAGHGMTGWKTREFSDENGVLIHDFLMGFWSGNWCFLMGICGGLMGFWWVFHS